MVFFLGGNEYQLWYAVFCMFHVVRGFMGFIMSRVFPTSHEIISKLDYSGNRQLIFAQLKPDLSNKIKQLLLKYYEDYELPAKVYSGLSCLTILIDIIAFWVYIGKIGLGEDLSSQTVYFGQLFSVFFYFILDVFFFLYLVHFRFRLPEQMKEYLPRALVGLGDKMKQVFGQKSDHHEINKGNREDKPKKKGGSGSMRE